MTFTAGPREVCQSSGADGATITLTGAGICTVVASQAGNGQYLPATPVSRSFGVLKASQTIDFGSLGSTTLPQSPVVVSATASSGLSVSFLTLTPKVCLPSGKDGASITLAATGTCTVVAYQLGNADYLPALPVTRSFSVTKAEADLTVTVTASNGTPTNGTDVTFTVTVTNDGPDAAQDVTVSDALPAGLTFLSDTADPGSYDSGAGTWTIGTLAADATGTLNITAQVNDSSLAAITDTATAATTTADLNASPTGSVTINPAAPPTGADLTATVSVNNSTPTDGSNVVLTFTVTNDGPDAAQDVILSGPWPTALAPGRASGDGEGFGVLSNGISEWMIGTLDADTTDTLTVDATVSGTASITLAETAATTTTDLNPDPSASVTIYPVADS